jgi:AraC-like DNA-binding protein
MIRFHDYGYGEFNANRYIGPACWPHFDLLSIYKGCVAIRLMDRDEVVLRAGHAILLYPQTAFVGRTLTATSSASVQHFELPRRARTLPPPLQQLIGLRPGYKVCHLTPAIRADTRRAIALAQQVQTPSTHAMRIALLTLILAQLNEHGLARSYDGEESAPVRRAINWASEQRIVNVRIEDMAAQAGLSMSHFRSVFAAVTGTAPGKYLRDLRLIEARRLLRETGTPIKTIAVITGYSDVAHFHRAFTAQARKTPLAYRRAHSPCG